MSHWWIRLQDDFSFTGKPVDGMPSQFVKIGDHRSSTVWCGSGILQGSVRGSFLLSVYVSPIMKVVAEHGVGFHQFADNMQIYIPLCCSGQSSNIQKTGPVDMQVFHLPSTVGITTQDIWCHRTLLTHWPVAL